LRPEITENSPTTSARAQIKREQRNGGAEVRFTHRPGVLQTLVFGNQFFEPETGDSSLCSQPVADFEVTIVLSNLMILHG
jgi:hypothetical protein